VDVKLTLDNETSAMPSQTAHGFIGGGSSTSRARRGIATTSVARSLHSSSFQAADRRRPRRPCGERPSTRAPPRGDNVRERCRDQRPGHGTRRARSPTTSWYGPEKRSSGTTSSNRIGDKDAMSAAPPAPRARLVESVAQGHEAGVRGNAHEPVPPDHRWQGGFRQLSQEPFVRSMRCVRDQRSSWIRR